MKALSMLDDECVPDLSIGTAAAFVNNQIGNIGKTDGSSFGIVNHRKGSGGFIRAAGDQVQSTGSLPQ